MKKGFYPDLSLRKYIAMNSKLLDYLAQTLRGHSGYPYVDFRMYEGKSN